MEEGIRIDFDDQGEYTTEDEEIIKALRKKRYYGIDLFEMNEHDENLIKTQVPQRANIKIKDFPKRVINFFKCAGCDKRFESPEILEAHQAICPILTSAPAMELKEEREKEREKEKVRGR